MELGAPTEVMFLGIYIVVDEMCTIKLHTSCEDWNMDFKNGVAGINFDCALYQSLVVQCVEAM